MEQEQIIRKVSEIGNGAHIFAPKEWMNEKVLIIRIEKKNINEEILKILSPHLNKIIAVFIYGSHARAEASETSDIDVLIISKEKFKIEKKRNFEFLVIPDHFIESAIKINPILMYSIFREAKAIINEDYLEKYKNKKINLRDFSSFIESTKKISIKSSENLLELDRKTGKTVSTSVLYSVILRLRGIFIIECLLKNKVYSNSSFRAWIKRNIEIDYEKVYEVYRAIRDNKKIKDEIPIETGEKLINFLKKEIDKLSKDKNDKQKKEAEKERKFIAGTSGIARRKEKTGRRRK